MGGATSGQKVLTHGFSAKKETVWCDLCQKFFISLFTSTDYTWDNKRFATGTNSEFANWPVLHIVLVDLWDTGQLANSEFVLVTNVFLSHVFNRNREGEGGARAVLLGGGWLMCSLACFSCCTRMGTLLWVKTHMGCLLRQYPWPLATRFGVKKEVVWRVLAKNEGVWCDLSKKKVLTHRFLAKKEVMWHDLSAIFHDSAKKEGVWCNLRAKGADSWIFSEKGSCVA